MKSSVSTVLVFVLIVAIILAVLWLIGGGKQLGGIKIGDTQTATTGNPNFKGSTPPGTMYPDANDPAPMVGETERNGRLSETGDAGGGDGVVIGHGSSSRPTVAAGYIDRDWNRPVIAVSGSTSNNPLSDLDPSAAWANNPNAPVATNKTSITFGVYPGSPSASNCLITADDVDGSGANGTTKFLASSNLWPNQEDGWLSEWLVNFPGPGRYCLRLWIVNEFGGSPMPADENYWMIEVR